MMIANSINFPLHAFLDGSADVVRVAFNAQFGISEYSASAVGGRSVRAGKALVTAWRQAQKYSKSPKTQRSEVASIYNVRRRK